MVKNNKQQNSILHHGYYHPDRIPKLCRLTRRRLGLTQQEFARLIGVSTPTVQRWEYGVTKPRLLQSDIINQINQRMHVIEKEEEMADTYIGNLLKPVLSGEGQAYCLYKFLDILFNENTRKD